MEEILKEKQKGITLIALVITIIVLLILAGVSIAILVGDNGILTQANKAKANTEIAEEREQISLAWLGALTSNHSGEVTAAGLNTEFSTNRVSATASGRNPIKVLFSNTQRKYTIDSNGVISGPISTEDNEEAANRELVVEDIIYTKNQ